MSEILYHWILSLASFRFCETQYLHFTTRVFGQCDFSILGRTVQFINLDRSGESSGSKEILEFWRSQFAKKPDQNQQPLKAGLGISKRRAYSVESYL